MLTKETSNLSPTFSLYFLQLEIGFVIIDILKKTLLLLEKTAKNLYFRPNFKILGQFFLVHQHVEVGLMQVSKRLMELATI